MSANVTNYKQVNSLPNFNLFAWFFIIPGILLVLLSGAGLWTAGALHLHVGRPHPAA